MIDWVGQTHNKNRISGECRARGVAEGQLNRAGSLG